AERKAVNKYYPSDWDPRKHGSINKFRGSHPLRERARKIHEGILVVRFEMPYNIWCEGCNNHIGMGVRYNAQKSKTGMYYSTPIYKFRMKCHLCDSHFEMQTDPKNLDYVILNGARRQERRWDPTQNEQVVPEDKDTSNKLATDKMFLLEHTVEQTNRVNEVKPVIEKLEKLQERWKDDYSANQLMRKNFRTKKKETLAIEENNKNFLKRKSLLNSGIKLIPENEDDAKLASLMKLQSTETYEDKRLSDRLRISSESIFSTHQQKSQLQKIASSINAKKMELLSNAQSITKEQLGITNKSHQKSLVANYGTDSE
ncbi:coiled-coil domain-containing protein 130-like protein, partial [Leptotrombidium deliense]